ncbi:hypothetical protein I4F81_008047 [Pyropia yezoensis]|uniref:Uncharacterized protein n=1 Tax=Pyropia yezoensis TaxID=2788 RepID=A0ACC3C5E6_PYRYE|nr:hypothetical protein I4F81_008047 [Neopyropia yezoensis]
MQEAPGAPGFAEFSTAVLENVEKNKLATSTLLALAGSGDSSLSGSPEMPPTSAPGESMPVCGGPVADPAGSVSVTHGPPMAELARSALCSIAREFSVRLCVSSLSEVFIKREMTASGSTPVPIGVLQLVEPGRVAEAVRVVLGDRKKGFQVTSKAGSASVMPSESIGVCLGALSGGHPRTADILIGAIEKSRDGEPFLGSFMSMLQPESLSLAAASVDILSRYPIVVAVGLLGAIYNTRLSVSFLLEVINRKALTPRVNTAAGERLQRAAVVDEDIYASLQGVSAALDTGFAPVAWEQFVFSGLTVVSQARRICSQKLGKLERDGREQRPLDRLTLLDLFPASPPYVSSVAWLEDATVDASRALAGVRLFSSFSSLLDKNDEELVIFVWQADKTNFPAVYGVLFYLCTGCEARPGPRRGQLVVVFLQMKNKENVTVKKDVIDSARTASKLFKAAVDDPSWTSRCAFVVLSCQEQTLQRNVDLGATDLPVLVVDEAGLQATFGPGLHALIRSSAIAFGTQVIDLTRAEFSER